MLVPHPGNVELLGIEPGEGVAERVETADLGLESFDHGGDRGPAIRAVGTIGTAIHVNLSMVTIEDGEVTKRLAAWAAIFAVCTALAGIWGMNFEFMPELKWKMGYPVALLLMAAIGLILYRRFRKVGWL